MITRRRVFAAVLIVWILGLAYTVQPGHVSRLPVRHAHPLDVRVDNLPTLAPYKP